MAHDNVCKYPVERFPEQFAQWLLGSPIPLTQLDPAELSAEPIRANSVILLSALDRIPHLGIPTCQGILIFWGWVDRIPDRLAIL